MNHAKRCQFVHAVLLACEEKQCPTCGAEDAYPTCKACGSNVAEIEHDFQQRARLITARTRLSVAKLTKISDDIEKYIHKNVSDFTENALEAVAAAAECLALDHVVEYDRSFSEGPHAGLQFHCTTCGRHAE